jgi:YegS/Rv2252/BmrU family lipid kinase
MIPEFLVNPHASGVDQTDAVDAIRRELLGKDHVVSSSLRDRNDESPRFVVVVGGDGTVNWVINRFDVERLWLGVIPMGGANDLASELAIPHGIASAWPVVSAGRFEAIDLVQVNGRRFATCGGLGLATDVALLAARWKSRRGWRGRVTRRLGSAVYLLATVIEVFRRRPSIRADIEAGTTSRHEVVSMLIVSNQPRIGAHFSASPSASNRDGLVDVCIVRAPGSRLRLLWICFQLFRGTPHRCREIEQVRCSSLTIRTDREMTFFGDGEPLTASQSFQIMTIERALRVTSARNESARSHGHTG